MARDRLYRLQQRENNSVSAYSDAFLQIMTYLPNMAVEDQVDQYQRRLLPAIRDELDRIMATADESNTHNLGWIINQAQRIESRLAMHKKALPGWRNQSQHHATSTYRSMLPSSSTGSSTASASAAADSSRMDLSQLDISHVSASDRGAVSTPSRTEWAPAWLPSNSNPSVGDYHGNLSAMYNGPRNTHNRRVPNLSKQDFDQLSREGRCFGCRQTGHLARNCPRLSQHSMQAQNQLRLK